MKHTTRLFSKASTAALAAMAISTAYSNPSEQVAQTASDTVNITIHPTKTRSIAGISKIDRNIYFSLCDEGANLDKKVKTAERFDYLTKELDVRFGRLLGPVQRFVKHSKSVQEDPNRPTFADITHLKKHLEGKTKHPSEKMKATFGDNLDVAAHGNHHGFPKFMGEFFTEAVKKEDHPESIPDNIEAAAELSASIFKYGYNDFTRPRYYEPLNEPHWSYFGTEKLAQWHLLTHEKIKALTPEVQVGGLCMSVPYLYRDQYRVWKDFGEFMNNTKGKLDFYSLHVYDYYQNKEAGRNESRISSGLPFEGVLDLINNHAVNSFGKEVKIVISEHGGYTLNKDNSPQAYDGESLSRAIYDEYIPKAEQKEGFAGEQERRSIVAWLHLDTIITNTLTFMDSPQSVQKAVPFILINTESWDPKYYASTYVPQDYKKGAEWTESFLLNFYKFFRGVDGRRVLTESNDPDLQVRSFANGDTVYTVVKNLSLKAHNVSLKGLKGASNNIRHLSRGENLLPTYKESKLESTDNITLASRDSILLVSTFPTPVKEASVVSEKIFYGDKITIKTNKKSPKATINIDVPNAEKASSSILRLGISRALDGDYNVDVLLNGEKIDVPMEDAADRLYDKKGGYASTKMIPLKKGQLKEKNIITVSFPDGNEGSIGTAVIRAQF